MKRFRLLAGLLSCLVPHLASCGGEPQSTLADSGALERSAWLGSAESWGLIGIPLNGGPLGYLRAQSFEAPTWAPPDLGKLTRAWPGDNAIWVQLAEGGLSRYEYVTGHILSYEDVPTVTRAVAPTGSPHTLVVATEAGELRLVGGESGWRRALRGRLERLLDAGDGRVLTIARTDSGTLLQLLHPPDRDPLGERMLADGVVDLAITPWGERVYCLPAASATPALKGLELPDLTDAESFELPDPGYAVAATPSGHRLYVSTGRSLHVFDRLGGKQVREIELPHSASALRFSANGATLLARLADSDSIMVVEVGVDSVLGTLPSAWGDQVPAAVPGGRVVASLEDSLVLFSVPGLLELARYGTDASRVWVPVEWQPPRPRQELARAASPEATASRSSSPRSEAEEPETAAPAGHYAVVSAAQERSGVENLVSWLRSVGYPARVDQHADAMGAVWFRAMVGPYPGRPAAEAASRSLNSRYGYKPWILVVEQGATTLPGPADADTLTGAAGGAPEDTVGEAGNGEGEEGGRGGGEGAHVSGG